MQPFAGERVHPRRGVAHQSPVCAHHAPPAQRVHPRRRQHVAVKFRALPRNAFFFQKRVEMFLHGPRAARRQPPADSYRKMIGAREGPDIAGKPREKFDFDGLRGHRYEIAHGEFEILVIERSGAGQQWIARARCQDHEIGGDFPARGQQPHPLAGGVHLRHPRPHHFAARRRRPLQQQPVQHLSRVNHDRPVQRQKRPLPRAGNQLALTDHFLGLRAFTQEGIGDQRFVRQPATAGFFPGEVLVEDGNAESRGRKPLAAKGPCGPSAHNGDVAHLEAGFRPAGRRPPRTKRSV